MSTVRPRHALTIRECWECLASTPVGRVAYVRDGRPEVRLVNFTTSDGHIVIWSRPGSKAKALRNQVVAFQADQIDPGTGTGRSVVVLGTAGVVSDEDESLSQIEPVRRPWVSGSLDNVIRIRVQQLTGQHLEWPPASTHPEVRPASPGHRVRTTAGRAPLVELDAQQCWTYLRATSVGRLVSVAGTLPAIQPVRYTIRDRQIVCWSQDTDATVRVGDSVAVEVGDIDRRTRSGWSAVAQGVVETVEPTVIRVAQVTGRQVLPAAGLDGDIG